MLDSTSSASPPTMIGADSLAELLGEDEGVGLRRNPRRQYAELVSSETGDGVGLAHGRAQPLGDLP